MDRKRLVRDQTRRILNDEETRESVRQPQTGGRQKQGFHWPHVQILQEAASQTEVKGWNRFWLIESISVKFLRESEYYGKVQRPELEENYRNPKPRGSAYETSDRGLALIEGCLRGLPRERLTNISSDVSSLKTELRAAARRETDEVKSRMKPNSAHKVYAWRDLLEEREQKSAAYKSTKVKWTPKRHREKQKSRFQVRCSSLTRLTTWSPCSTRSIQQTRPGLGGWMATGRFQNWGKHRQEIGIRIMQM